MSIPKFQLFQSTMKKLSEFLAVLYICKAFKFSVFKEAFVKTRTRGFIQLTVELKNDENRNNYLTIFYVLYSKIYVLLFLHQYAH